MAEEKQARPALSQSLFLGLLRQGIADLVIVTLAADENMAGTGEPGGRIDGAGHDGDIVEARGVPEQLRAAALAEATTSHSRRLIPPHRPGGQHIQIPPGASRRCNDMPGAPPAEGTMAVYDRPRRATNFKLHGAAEAVPPRGG